MKRQSLPFTAMLAAACLTLLASAEAIGKPNILMIMSDPVGITNLSAYSRGMAGYRTPNIDRQLVGLRYDDWKLVFMEQRASAFQVWAEPFVPLRIPKIFNLRTDPFERADKDANNYERWWIERSFALVRAQTFVGAYIATFKEFPAR